MDDTILSGDLKLSAHVAVPNPPLPSLGLVLCHGLPNPPRGAATVGTTYPDLADHIANEAGLDRPHVQLPRHRARRRATSPRTVGSTTCAPRCARCTRVPTCAGCGSRASATAERSRCARRPTTTSCAAWRRSRHRARCATGRRIPARLLAHARSMGMIRSEGFPSDATRWVRDIGRVDAVAAAAAARPSSAPRAARRGGHRGAGRRTRGRSPTPVARTPSCGWCRARATGCATTRVRSPRSSGGWRVRCRAARA